MSEAYIGHVFTVQPSGMANGLDELRHPLTDIAVLVDVPFEDGLFEPGDTIYFELKKASEFDE